LTFLFQVSQWGGKDCLNFVCCSNENTKILASSSYCSITLRILLFQRGGSRRQYSRRISIKLKLSVGHIILKRFVINCSDMTQIIFVRLWLSSFSFNRILHFKDISLSDISKTHLTWKKFLVLLNHLDSYLEVLV
jgi:hypothetical protein